MSKPIRIGIIGAGPAGMMAALQAAWRGVPVTLFDANPGVGRKLLVTGSGRCNLTNQGIAPDRYVCDQPELLARLFVRFGREDLIHTLEKIGILVHPTPDGWYYPCSESAATVVDAFAAALVQAGVELRMESRVTGLQHSRAGFTLRVGEAEWICDSLVVAAGGQAYPTLGSRGDLYPQLERLGHTLRPAHPALAPVVADVRSFHKLQGVRLDAVAQIWQAKTLLGQTTGNLIFTQWGFNGPAVMDLSHLVSTRAGKNLTLVLNLLPGEMELRLRQLLAQKRREPIPLRVLLGAVLPPKVPAWVLAVANLPVDLPMQSVSEPVLEDVLHRLMHLSASVQGVRGFEFAQVSTGGVPLAEVNPETMESNMVPGLYLAGETLDVIGPCGGFNLQFAFSSGAAAGLGCRVRA
ncbi:MAG TPA: aminoacetone oxidase family FAD-binding enzyme [Anaerolineaceae bacterium]|nr:aminoacetone oxidase family FAD-binding enzyme [Anaerolineaceae bacterium]